MGFLMDGLDAEAYDRNYTDRDLVRRILGYFGPQARRMGGVIVAITASSLLEVALPVYLSRSLDALPTQPNTRQLLIIGGIIMLLGALSWAFNYARRAMSARAVGDVVLKLRQDAFDAVLKRDLSFYDSIPSGKLVSRVNSDTQAFSQVVTLAMDMVSHLLLVVLLIGYLFTVDTTLAWITLALAPPIVLTALAFRHIARQTITQSRRVGATVSAHIQETVSGIAVAKAFRQEQAAYDEFVGVNAQSLRINRRTGYVFSAIFPILNALAGVGTAALVYFGGRLVWSSSTLTAGDWYLFIQGIRIFWFPLTSIASFWSQFQVGLAAAERVFGLLDAEPRVVQTGNAQLLSARGEITFEGMNFHYNAGEPVLEDFSLRIRAGETLALVGHTGSGKSSIGRLIARFYEFQGGRLLIDNHDIRGLNLPSYRAHLGIVTQSPFLFDGSVLENIRYGRPDASADDVHAAARAAFADEFLRALPEGYDTFLGERGVRLSGGQRQRIAIARAMLKNPPLLLLDEATSALDAQSERMVQAALESAMQGRTTLVIAHRLATVQRADRIVVLDHGGIVEQGTHAALVAQGGVYARLAALQFTA